MMRQVEGGNSNWMMRILRHEAGHAIDTAWRLRRRARWREVFGPASLPYPDRYRARPGSRRYVHHLGEWYAQAHPTEDFAETFAVWLKPNSDWRRSYACWPARHKLQFVGRTDGRGARRRGRRCAAGAHDRAAATRTGARSPSTMPRSSRAAARWRSAAADDLLHAGVHGRARRAVRVPRAAHLPARASQRGWSPPRRARPAPTRYTRAPGAAHRDQPRRPAGPVPARLAARRRCRTRAGCSHRLLRNYGPGTRVRSCSL